MFSKSLFLISLGLFYTVSGLRSEDQVALYLVKDKLDVDHLNDLDPNKVEVADAPLLRLSDIVEFRPSDRSFKVKDEALERIYQEMRKRVYGTAVVAVCQRGHPVYLGVLWNSILSVRCPNLIFSVHYPFDRNTIRIRAGYPKEEDYSGKDPNISWRVYSLFGTAWGRENKD